MPPRILVPWLIFGPLLAAVVSFITGEAMIPKILLAIGGGLIGGTGYSLGGTDTSLSVLWVLFGAITLMLLRDLYALALS